MSPLARFAPAFTCAVAAWLCALAPAAAQETSARDAPAHISFVEGTAVLERDGETDTSPASMPLLAGDRVRTRAGRVEILFADGSTLHFDHDTVVDFQSDEVVRLLEGRIRLNIPGPDRTIAYRIDTPTGWVEVKAPGEYRVALAGGDRREVELAVLRGAADLVNENGATDVLAGERAFAAAGAAPSQPYVFNSAAWDAFDQWSEARRDQRLGISTQYLPAEVRPYAASLDYYGTWRHEPAYGYVWYPRVAVGWRPYYYGRWSHLRPFGWTWVGHDPWAWPTHHYGRWGFSAGVWFWIPGRHWGPAWVSWAYAPGYVSWCPLGFNNRPVFAFNAVNVFRGRRFDPWHAWTVVPHRRFGSGFVNVNVVNVNRLDTRARRAFAVRDVAPDYTGRAIPRAQAPIRAAGARTGYAVPRDGSRAIGAASPSSNARSRDAFRQRGSSGGRLSGPGFPEPAREPRSVATPRSRSRPNPSATAPDRTAPRSVTPERGRAAPRAAPRTAPDAPERGTPSRRVSPGGERTPPAPARGSGSGAVSAPGSSNRSRAVPRSGAPAAAPAPGRGSPSRRAAPRGGGGSAESSAATSPAPSWAAPRLSARPSTGEPSRRSYRGAPAPAAAPSSSAPGTPSRSRGIEGRGDAFRAPGRTSGRAPDRPSYQSPTPRRASPEPSPRMSAPAPGSRSSPGAVRGAPGRSSPGPQRSAGSAPGQSGGGSARSDGSTRSRGDRASTGRAVSRRGGER